jgi:hypothetical protein
MWVALVPGMFAVDMLFPTTEGLPVGVGDALGCSGGPNLPAVVDGWTALSPRLSHTAAGNAVAEESFSVATDGFFAISGEGNPLSLEQARAQLRVVVRDEDGLEVPGDISVLRSEPTRDSHLFGWVARQPLALGARLTVTLATEPATPGDRNVGGEFRLKVEGAATAPSAPVVKYEDWGTFYRGDGEVGSVQCMSSARCGPRPTLSLPPRVTEHVAAQVHWMPPEVVGGVAWRVRVEPDAQQAVVSSAESTLDDTGAGQELFGKVETAYRGVHVDDVIFQERADDYCVTVVLEDLRTGLEQRSELCAAPGPLQKYGTDTELAGCLEPPSAELTRAWCELSQSTLPECGAAGAEQAETPADAGAAASEVDVRATAGCALGGAHAGAPGVASLAGLAATWLLRRRPRRARATGGHGPHFPR